MNQLVLSSVDKNREHGGIVPGSTVLHLASHGHALSAPNNDSDALSISIFEDSELIHVVLIKDLENPLAILGNTTKNISLLMKSGLERAHVILSLKASGSFSLEVEPHAHGALYVTNTESFNGSSQKNMSVVIDDSASLNLYEIVEGERGHVQEMKIELMGEAAAISYYGLHQLCGQAKQNSLLNIHHQAPRTKSTQAFRGIYGEEAQGSFLGKVLIDQSACLSEAQQLYRAVVLGDRAQAHVLPQLEINNDDIRASHGASIGKLDEDALFYLSSRGLSPEQAKSILITSIVEEIIQKIEEPSIKAAMLSHLSSSLDRSIGDQR